MRLEIMGATKLITCMLLQQWTPCLLHTPQWVLNRSCQCFQNFLASNIFKQIRYKQLSYQLISTCALG